MGAAAVIDQPSGDVVAAGLYERIGAFLAAQGLSPDPAHYAFAYAVVSQPGSAVARAVAALTDGGFRISRQDLERLGGAAIPGAPLASGEPPAEPVDTGHLLARAQVQVDDFSHAVRAMHAETRGFGADLVASVAAIDTAGALDEVARLTGAMIARVRDAEARLASATHEVDTLRDALDEARGAARVDPLTDLPNRRAFDEAFLGRGAGEACLALCDIDRFKTINDRFGHPIGDRVLRVIAQALTAQCEDCTVARYGGEEFVMLIPGDTDSAAGIVEAARRHVAAKRFRLRDTAALLGTVTFSAGVTRLGQDDTLTDAILRADQALYRAKADGRNRVCIAPEFGG